MTKSITKVLSLLEEFVEKRSEYSRISRLFDIAYERERSGFEKWLQFEFVLFLHEKHECVRFDIEFRSKSGEKDVLIDLFLTLDGGEFIAIELKVRSQLKHAISALRSDLVKLSNVDFGGDSKVGRVAVALLNEDVERIDRSFIKKELGVEFVDWKVDVDSIGDNGKFHFLVSEIR